LEPPFCFLALFAEMAISRRLSGVNRAARATPPTLPPATPRLTSLVSAVNFATILKAVVFKSTEGIPPLGIDDVGSSNDWVFRLKRLSISSHVRFVYRHFVGQIIFDHFT
jgi:hypothetical protein